jgi:hypothetical protein
MCVNVSQRFFSMSKEPIITYKALIEDKNGTLYTPFFFDKIELGCCRRAFGLAGLFYKDVIEQGVIYSYCDKSRAKLSAEHLAAERCCTKVVVVQCEVPPYTRYAFGDNNLLHDNEICVSKRLRYLRVIWTILPPSSYCWQ